jgi:hypothetical protein
MITYGTNELNVKSGTLSITQSKVQTVRHYPGTDISDVVNLGKPPTRIRCILQVFTESDRTLYESILQSEGTTQDLTIGDRYYKSVIASDLSDAKPIDNLGTGWEFNAEFIALDPKPYSVATDEVLY